jgi:hypothetical protein
MWDVLKIKIMNKKLKLDEPQFIKDIPLFTNQSIDDLWNIQGYDFKIKEEKYKQLRLS